MKNIYIILGSIREGRTGIHIFNWISDQFTEFLKTNNITDVSLTKVDLKEWALPMFAEGKSPKNGIYDNPKQVKWSEFIKQADGFLFVTPEYNHGYSSVLKNALDYLYSEWNNKAAAFVGYGGVGGARAIQQLRQVFVELRMLNVRPEVNIFAPWSALDENKIPKKEFINGSTEHVFKELVEMTKAK